MASIQTYTAFLGKEIIANGDLLAVSLAAKSSRPAAGILVFCDETGRQTDLDLRGSEDDIRSRLTPPPAGPGRPKLGVVAREVTLLPRHWEWLNEQPGGASVALRKLVDEARKTKAGADQIRRSQDAAYRFMTVLAGDLPCFEEAARALYACDSWRFDQQVASWPTDVQDYCRRLANGALAPEKHPLPAPS